MQHVHIRCMWLYRVNMMCSPYVQDVGCIILVLYMYLSVSLTLWIPGNLVYLTLDHTFSYIPGDHTCNVHVLKCLLDTLDSTFDFYMGLPHIRT